MAEVRKIIARTVGTGKNPAGLRPVQPVSVFPDAQWQADYNNILRRVSYFAALLFIFLKFSFGHEILSFVARRNLYLLYLVAPPAIAGMLLSGGIRRSLQYRPAVYWLLFGAWTMLGTPFSFWPGGTFSYSLYYIRFELPLLFVIAGTIMTWEECRRALYVVAAAGMFDIAFGLTHQDASTPRLDLGFGTIGNANDFAAHLLLLAPFAIFVFLRPRTPVIIRLTAALFTALAFHLIIRTGSRGALIAIAVATVYFLIRATMMQRIVTAIIVPVGFVLIFLLTPGRIVERLKSFSAGEGSTKEAIESKQARQYLLRQSLRFTFEHPVFGVGMGQFSPYEDSRSRKEGAGKGQWHETHNAYTQASSECGIPALLFYVAAVVSSFRLLRKTWHDAQAFGHAEIAAAALWMTVALAAFTTAIFFLSLAYRFYLPGMSGLAIALYSTAQLEFRRLRMQPSPTPSPASVPKSRLPLPPRRPGVPLAH